MSQMPPGQPGPYPNNPYPQGPPPRKRSWFARHKILTALGVVIVFIVIIIAATSGGSSSPDSTSASGTATASEAPRSAAAAPRPGIGAPASDGKFEFVVRGVRDGGTSVGPDFLAERAQGHFVLVDLTIRNTGDKAQSFDVSSQKLLSGSGTQYSADSQATISFDSGNTFYEQVNPGNTLEATIVFDVPTGTTPAAIELHDSVFSGGVEVKLA
ncbi:DUF4352 domain-containing protein [Williamsia sterculiae]|uniref:DUF4352 domain-containing protein n=1 Tax=Williamsia sterculiae TaxID=1344003 RepID=A0A1N7FYK8_9NOCA|nr:DUF4352 domain-containing protein [Williamsia sterculiae]SIS05367.1 protein of unknown function [Williamsia sterculiae]